MAESGCLRDMAVQNLEVAGKLVIGTGSVERAYVAIVENTIAFVRNAASEVQWAQPADTIIRSISLLFPSAAYSTGTGNDLGYRVGTATGGGQIVTAITDQIIDAGADGTDIATGAWLQTTVPVPTPTSGTTLGAHIGYAAADRAIFLGTTCTDAAAVPTPGAVRWIIEYTDVSV